MNKFFAFVITGLVMLNVQSIAQAQARPMSYGLDLKGAAQTAVQSLAQKLSPEAQANIDQAKKLGAGAPQENFLLAKAKEYLAARNYQPAIDLANYVVTALNSKSLDAQKILTDAKAALAKMLQEKMAQSQNGVPAVDPQAKADVVQAGNSLKGLLGAAK